jgi:hypothetical protein
MDKRRNLIRIFEYALNQEETGKSFFETSLHRLGIGAAVSAFKRLIQEEEGHIAFIQSILSGLREGREPDLSAAAEVVLKPTRYFDQRAKSEFLDQCVEGSMVPDAAMAEKAQGRSRDALLMLSEWEKGHERFFKEYRDKLSEVYSKMPWGG